MKTVHITVMGRVQGVWFRASAKEMADKLGVNGWARNNLDGSVEMAAQGEEAAVEKFIEWCHEGPPMAKIEKVTLKEGEVGMDQQGFRI